MKEESTLSRKGVVGLYTRGKLKKRLFDELVGMEGQPGSSICTIG